MTSGAVIAAVAAYIAILFLVAWLSGRRADNAGFFTGNRRTPWYMAAFAMIGGAMSGITFVSVPGSVADDSFSYMQMVFGFAVGQCAVAFVLVPLFYRLHVVSLYEYLDARFGAAAHHTGAWFFFVSQMLRASLKVFVVCAVMQQLVFDAWGVPLWGNAAFTMLLVWLYTRRGGVKSLIWTDALKTTCLVGSLVLTLFFVVRALGFTGAEAAEYVVRSPLSRVFFFDDPSSGRYFWKMFFAGIFVLVAMTGLDQDMMQKNLSCATPRDAQKNIMLTACCQTVVILLFLVLGVFLYAYAARAGLALPDRTDGVFPLVAVHGGLPAVGGLLFVVGLGSGTWSAAGSALTALTTSFTVDILGAARRCDERGLTRVRHGVHLALAAAMTLVILCFDAFADDSVINLVYKVASYTYGPLLGMFAFGMCTRLRVRERRIPAVAVAAPLLSALLQYVLRVRCGYQIGFELLVYNALFTVAGMLLLVRRHEK